MVTKFNPITSSPEVIKKTLSGRDHVVQIIVKDIAANTKRKHLQHHILIGPRGIGKTHLLRYLSIYTHEDKELKKKFIPFQTAEEEFQRILSLRDFFEIIVSGLIDILNEDNSSPFSAKKTKEIHENLESLIEKYSEKEDKEALPLYLDALRNIKKSTGIKILLLMDNIDEVLGKRIKKEEELGQLRKILMNEDWLMLIGSAPTYFKEITRYGRPFYNFFRVTGLEPLKEQEEIDLICRLASLNENTREICERLKNDPDYSARVKAISYLTGGNPRLTVMLFETIQSEDVKESTAILKGLLDSITPYFMAKMEKLTPQQQKIVDAIARMSWDEGFAQRLKKKKHPEALIKMLKETSLGILPTPTSLSASTRVPVNQVNTILGRLDELGVVQKASIPDILKEGRGKKQNRSDARHKVYQLTEPLYHVYHQYRNSRSYRKRYVIFVNFLRIWFGEKEIYSQAKKMIGRLQESFQKEPSEAMRIMEYTQYLYDAASGTDKSKIGNELFNTLLKADKLEECEKMIQEDLKNEKTEIISKMYNQIGIAYAKKKDYQKSIRFFQIAVEGIPDEKAYGYIFNYGKSLSYLGQLTNKTQYFEKSFKKFAETIKIRPDYYKAFHSWGAALSYLGLLTQKAKYFEESCKKNEEAINIKPDNHEVFYNWGNALSDLGLLTNKAQYFEESLKKYEGAIKIKPDNHVAFNNWGNSLLYLFDIKKDDFLLDEAYKKIAKALEYDEDPRYFANAARLTLKISSEAINRNNPGNAKEYYKKALDYGKKGIKDLYYEVLNQYFMSWMAPSKLDVMDEWFLILEKDGDKDLQSFLTPFFWAYLYWKQDGDAEILERIPEEQRKIVAEIISDGEKRDKEQK